MSKSEPRPTLHSHPGFTLIELMVAVAIVAILAAIALPGYQQQVRQARRADGQTALLAIALAQEQFRAQCPRYASALSGARTCSAAGSGTYRLDLETLSQDGHYRLSLVDAGAGSYRALATPLGGQTQDRARGVECNPLSIDQSGLKTPAACWP